jgi:hypothetical protein
MSASPERVDPHNAARWRSEAAAEIASLLVRTPPMEYRGNSVQPEYGAGNPAAEPTPAQIEAVKKSDAYRSVCALIEAGCQQQGSPGGYQSMQRAIEFFQSCGMIYRLRVEAMKREAQKAESKKKLSLDKIPVIFPTYFQLWHAPRFKFESRGEGADSMEACTRDELVGCATQFYRSGVRCQWFEKALLEALVSAELYATIKYAKTTPAAWTSRAGFWVTMLFGWAYGKTRGADPQYTLLISAGRLALWLVKLGIVLALGWQAWGAYERDHGWGNLIWLLILAGVLVGMAGNYLTQVIVGWVNPLNTVSVLQKTPFGRALSGVAEVHRVITAPSMSTSVAREAVLKSFELGGGLDQIIVPYLDRALTAGEFEWNLNQPYVEID